MEVWPAIDIRVGKCVRLCQGDFARETVYGEDPVEMALYWCELGARRLHVVDLDGARTGDLVNLSVVRRIVEAVSVPCQLGGGIRNREVIQALLDVGVARLVIGTRAVKDPQWFRQMCAEFPGRLVLGIDAREGWVATDGWTQTGEVPAVNLAKSFEDQPLAAIVYTDIARDGMLKGVNVTAMAQMQRAVRIPVIASGGVTTLDDIRALREAGLAGCILGRALYERRIALPEALREAGEIGGGGRGPNQSNG